MSAPCGNFTPPYRCCRKLDTTVTASARRSPASSARAGSLASSAPGSGAGARAGSIGARGGRVRVGVRDTALVFDVEGDGFLYRMVRNIVADFAADAIGR